MPPLDKGWQEVPYAPAPTAAPDQSGAFVVQLRAQPPGAPLAWDGRAEHVGLRAGDTLLLAGRVTGVHVPRPGGSAGPMKRMERAVSIWGMSASFDAGPRPRRPGPWSIPPGVFRSLRRFQHFQTGVPVQAHE
jgi:hypothetical protein